VIQTSKSQILGCRSSFQNPSTK